MKIKFLSILAIAAVVFMAACGKSDADLQKAVQDKLAADKITGVTVAVNGGVATLTGEITDITVKSKAETAAKSVEGVKSVTNNVTVKAPPPLPPSPDKMIEGTVNEAIKKLGITGITVSVADGVVTLTGEVTGRENLAKVMQAANESKPKKVENKLTVK
ncbi:MAG: BON domain-containing protein [Pyrinomonadaceae bacterium]